MRSGELDRLITIEQATESTDAYGAPTLTWDPPANSWQVWAQVKPIRGQEYFAAQQVNARVDTTFRIRYRSDITTKMRISYGGEYYDIQSIIELGRREGLELMAIVRQA